MKNKNLFIKLSVVLFLILLINILNSNNAYATDKEITFTDSNLYSKIKTIMSADSAVVSSNDSENKLTLTEETINSTTLLNIKDSNISDLSGIENFTNLSHLYMDNNNISDLSKLSTLTKLQYLIFNNNNVNDLTPLTDLTQLVEVQADNNHIMKLNPLINSKNTLTRIIMNNNELYEIPSALRDLGITFIVKNNTYHSSIYGEYELNDTSWSIPLPSFYFGDNVTLTHCTIKDYFIHIDTSKPGKQTLSLKANDGIAEGSTFTVDYVVAGDSSDDNTKNNENIIEITNDINTIANRDNTIANTILPQTGDTAFVVIFFITIGVIAIIVYKKGKEYQL